MIRLVGLESMMRKVGGLGASPLRAALNRPFYDNILSHTDKIMIIYCIIMINDNILSQLN